MYAGEFFLCYFFVPYKVNIPMYAGGFKQVLYKEYICWMQVKIYISDQTSLRICNSASLAGRYDIQFFLTYWPTRLHRLHGGIDSWVPYTFTKSGSVIANVKNVEMLKLQKVRQNN